ncbi:hypothetical protein ABIC78_004189 [Novosphingobium sp. 1529]|uniref:IS4 family transposase n=1 Tax=Novosphingobium sp. 1529 TaxID=3156424 RepID=UPI00339AC4AB
MLSQLLADHAALRRALGFKFRTPGILLRNFVAFAEHRGEHVVTTATVHEWALQAPSPEQRRNRLLTVRRFAIALHAEDPRHEVPSADLFGRASHRRRTPYIYDPGDIRRLIDAALRLGPEGSIRPITYATMFGLIAATGMRVAGSGDRTVKTEMLDAPSVGTHSIDVRVDGDTVEQVTLDIRFKRIHVRPPIGKQKRYPALDLTVIHAAEIGTPTGRKPILWKLVTDLKVDNLEDALEKIRWYAMRWKIEVFHKILKSGCRAEDAKLRTADRLANLVALFCIVSWRVLWMTMAARADPEASPTVAFTASEIIILDQLVAETGNRNAKPATLELYLIKLARLGGYLARKADPPPGNTVIWRGIRRLADIQIGAELGRCG